MSSDVRPSRHAFTLIEAIIVTGIIALLVSLFVATFGGVLFSARSAATQAAVQSIGQGVEAFRADFDSRPPPLVTGLPGDPTALSGIVDQFTVPAMLPTFEERRDAAREARYFSEWSLGVYLLGLSDLNGDGQTIYNESGNERPNRDDGLDGPGFRDPGTLLAWKRRDRDDPSILDHDPAQTGRTYGPYIDISNDFVEQVDIEGGIIMHRFVDAFGTPIRYYKDYLTRDEDKGVSSSLFMPQELRSGPSLEYLRSIYLDNPFSLPTTGQAGQQLTRQDNAVLSSPYTVLAAGADPNRYRAASGEVVAPFGDVIIGLADELINVDLMGDADNPEPFNPSDLILGPPEEVLEVLKLWQEYLDTNVRYTP